MIVVPPRKYQEVTLVCTRCEQPVVVRVARPDKWRYCPACLPIVTRERKIRNREAAKTKPRLHRYAGKD